MIVIIMIAILAAIAIPAFTHDTQRTKANAEVAAFFGELAIREEQFKVDNGSYMATVACPATTSQVGQAVDCNQPTKAWDGLNVQLPMANAYCSYKIDVGTGAGVQTDAVTGFVLNSPAGNWYYMSAICDMNGDGTNAMYYTNSVDSTIQQLNEGE